MPRANPNKRKPRAAEKRILIYGEGRDERFFIQHLKTLYARNSGVAITIRDSKGGARIVREAAGYVNSFDHCVVMMDNDRTPTEVAKARTAAKKHGIICIQNTPCLEALLLAIVSPQLSLAGKSSAWCKKEFEAKHMNSNKRSDPREYASIFPKSLLDKRRAHIPELARLISLIDGTAFK